MRIVKHGQIPSEKQQEITCFNCQTVFEVRNDELKFVPERRESYWCVKCPVCAAPIECGLAK